MAGLALHTVLKAEGVVFLPVLGESGRRMASNADGGFLRLLPEPANGGDLFGLGPGQSRPGSAVLGVEPEAELVADGSSRVALAADACADINRFLRGAPEPGNEEAARQGGYEASNGLFGPGAGRALVETKMEMLS